MLKESIKSPIFTDVAPEKLYYFDREQPNVRLAICPSRTSERGGEEYCVKEGGGEEGERERERAREVRPCLLLQDLVQSCLHGGGGGIWEDMCYERRRAQACVD
jgi:hypothetical protein